MSTPVVLAVDMGGTSLKGALVDEAGRTLHRETVALEGASGDAAFLALERFADGLAAACKPRRCVPAGCGVVAPGLDEARGVVPFASNLGWRERDVRAPLARRLGLPVEAGHDVRAAGLAESLLGAGRGVSDFVFVVIGTGIAAAVVANGGPVGGAGRMAGEFGHVPVHPGGEPCACGQRGCLEVYASAAGIARRYRAAGGGAATAAEIGASADPVARAVWGEAVEALALGLATLTMVLDPALFVLGGGLADAGPSLLDPLGHALGAKLAWRAAPPLRRSPLGASAGLLGAALIGWQAAGRRDLGTGWPRPSEAGEPPEAALCT